MSSSQTGIGDYQQRPGGGVGYRQSREHQDSAQGPAPGGLYLTPEERQVLRECNHESFWYRCVPLITVLATGTHICVTRGILKPHPRFNSLLKVMGASVIGFIAGKFSYQGECNKKIMALENSPLAEALKKGRRGRDVMQEMSLPDVPGVAEPSYTPRSSSDGGYTSNISIDTSSNIQSQGLDDSHRPNLDRDATNGQNKREIPTSSNTSYEELRQTNRANYQQRMEEYNRRVAATETQGQSERPEESVAPPRPSSSPERSKRVRRNQYGDIIED